MLMTTRQGKRCTALALIPLLLLSLLPPAALAQAPPAPGGEQPWPRQFPGASYTFNVYQPQIEQWDGVRLEAKAAVSVEHPASPQQDFGVLWITAQTQVDKATRLVTLTNIQISRASFPGAPGGLDTYLQILRSHLPQNIVTISLDRLQANLAVTAAQSKQQQAVPVKNDPPRILFSATPAYLVIVDGQPVLRQVEGSSLVRVINTYALILLDQTAGTYYLRFMGQWRQAWTLDGPWTVATQPPAALEPVRQSLAKNQQVNLLDDPAPELKDAVSRGILPTLFVSTVPTELLQTQGPPSYQPIDGTQLLTVQNTSANILIDLAANDTYVLLSGRWFRSKSLDKGSWAYVPNNALPADFAKIPETHPRGAVLASVAGTAQAQEALIDNTIPQTAQVDRTDTKLAIPYSEPPAFKSIEGTPLQYVANSPIPVIRVDASSWYAVKDGIWFVGTTPTGPWNVAASVPAVIYSIPPSSPLHYVTYAYVYGATPQYVTVGYTPGYYGTVVVPTGVVVYGTGYIYPTVYVGAFWYPPPPTYGFGVGFGWGAAAGFAFGFAAGAIWGGAWGHCCWGGGQVNINNNININHNNVYNKWNSSQVKSNAQSHWNSMTPQQQQQAKQQAQQRADQRPDKLTSEQRSAAQTKAQNVTPEQRQQAQQRAQSRPNDVFAGQDGNAYKRGADGGWDRSGSQGWNKANLGGESSQRLDQEQRSRSLGESRASTPSGRHGFESRGGGGFGGGGSRGGFRR